MENVFFFISTVFFAGVIIAGGVGMVSFFFLQWGRVLRCIGVWLLCAIGAMANDDLSKAITGKSVTEFMAETAKDNT